MTVDEMTQLDRPADKPAPADQLLLKINHEIRTAVNETLGMTELLLESQLTPEQSDHVKMIRMSVENLLTESGRILDLVRAESGSLQLDRCRFDPRQTLGQALELMSRLAGHHGIILKANIPDNLPADLIGDPMRISEMLFAVIRATITRIETGEISIAVRSRLSGNEAATISFSGVHAGPCVNCFEDGTALALARGLARMMDGDLTIRSRSDQGIEFNLAVTLEIASPADSEPRPAPVLQPLPHEGRQLRILVAEDGINNQLLIQAFLRDKPWEIDTAENGRIAVEKAANKSYNLILMDLDMPELDGYAATHRIRIYECVRQVTGVPIVALTAHNETEAVLKSLAAGCIAHVAKPFTKAGLLQTIEYHAV